MNSACRLCGSEEVEILFERPDTYFWHGPESAYFDEAIRPREHDARIMVCNRCGFLALPVDDDLRRVLEAYYRSPASCSGTTHGAGDLFAERRTREFFEWAARLGLQCPAGGAVLEVGCQRGHLLGEFQRRGASVTVGVEPGSMEPVLHDDGLPVDVRRGVLAAGLVPDASFDLAYSLNVFEHVEDPGEFLSNVHAALRPGGRLLLRVPNEFDGLRDGNLATFTFQHVSLFTPSVLRAAVEAHGFAVTAAVAEPFEDLFLVAEKVTGDASLRESVLFDRGRAEESRGVLSRFSSMIERRLERVACLAEDSDVALGLDGMGSPLSNLFSWIPGLREAGVRVFDSDPNKIGRRYGGLGAVTEGPDDLSDLTDIVVCPYRFQTEIEEFLVRSPRCHAEVHRLYAELQVAS